MHKAMAEPDNWSHKVQISDSEVTSCLGHVCYKHMIHNDVLLISSQVFLLKKMPECFMFFRYKASRHQCAVEFACQCSEIHQK